jgi:single-strand DNA-binding protein
MSGVNKVILIGNLGKDPEERHFEGGRVKVSFPLATSETYKNREGEKVETTEWHNIVLWNKLGEIAAKYLHKGDKVFIEGKIRTRSWEDAGVKKYMTEINADNMTMLSPRKTEETPMSSNQPQADSAQGFDNNRSIAGMEPSLANKDSNDDLPF